MPRSLTLSFDLLQTFVALVRQDGDAGQVMRALDLNQPTLSKRLAHLQHAGPLLDRPWLVRDGKTWRLTEEGRKVRPAVEELVDRYHRLHQFIDAGGAGPESGPVHFACGRESAGDLVRRAFGRFRRERPEARLRISTMRGRARIEGVSNGTLDLAIVSHDDADILDFARRPLRIEPLRSERFALVGSTKSPWGAKLKALPKESAPPEALTRFPLVLPEPDAGARKGMDEALKARGLLHQLQLVVEVGGWGAILGFVRDGLGVGVVSEGALDDTAGLTVRTLDPSVFPPIESKMICRRASASGDDLDLSETALAWRDALRREARDPVGSKR